MTLFLAIGLPQTDSSNVKRQDLRPYFAHAQLRQGRSPLLSTLPYQQANRYAVVDITSLILSQTRVVYLFTSRRIYKFTHLQTNKPNHLFTLPSYHLSKGEAVFSPFQPFIFTKAKPSFHLFNLSLFHLSTLNP